MTAIGEASRPVSDRGFDDSVLPFAVEALDVRGRVVRLGLAVDHILARHRYPAPVARLLGEAAALTVLLGAALKREGRFQLQTKSDGAVTMLVVDFDAPDRVRAFARYDAEQVPRRSRRADDLLGKGYLAFTIDQGNDLSRYQGVVALDGQGLEAAAHQYFRQSEQIPTLVRLAVAEIVTGEGASWRAGGLTVQFLPSSPERQRRQADLDPGDAPPDYVADLPALDDAWVEAQDACRDDRGPRTRRSYPVERAPAVPPVPRARRQGVRAPAGARRLPLLARADRNHAAQLHDRRSAAT